MSVVLSVLGYIFGVSGVIVASEAEKARSEPLHSLLVLDGALLIIVGTLLVLRPF